MQNYIKPKVNAALPRLNSLDKFELWFKLTLSLELI